MAHHRIYPGIERGAPDAYAELISSGAAGFEGGPAWKGDVELRLFESPTEELARLEVDEIIGGYYRQVGVNWDGGASLARRSATERLAGGAGMSAIEVEGVEVDTRHWINGERVASATTFTDISPIDETTLGEISAGGADEVDQAVAAARAAFPAWAALPVAERVGDPAPGRRRHRRARPRSSPGSRPATTGRCCARTVVA